MPVNAMSPATLFTLTAEGGVGGYRFDVVTDADGVARVGVNDGAFAVGDGYPRGGGDGDGDRFGCGMRRR